VPAGQGSGALEVAIGFEPCRWVGGDYADIVPMPDGRVLLTVADVCGKGFEAAMVASSLHTLVRATVDAGRSLGELVERINRHHLRYLPGHSFVTMVLLALDPETGELESFNAGHPPALVVDRAGGTRSLQSEAHPPFGMADLALDLHGGRLAPGEVLLMYTDGLTELRNSSKAMLGLEALHHGFARICASSQERSVAELGERLTQMLDQFRGGQLPEDDRAFLLARRAG
jgi:serine phosphatase RsbU (regulator of sigma subunit)